MSMFQGESENLVKRLFDAARECKPSIIFVDEIDSLVSSRIGTKGDESSCKVKTEFLVQRDGVGKDQAGVLVIGATNTPWDLDEALIRRFPKRIYIELLDLESRKIMLQEPFKKESCSVTPDEWEELAKRTEGYSGADIFTLANEALYVPVRKILKATHVKRDPSSNDSDPFYFICESNDPNAIVVDASISRDKIRIPEVTFSDLNNALAASKLSVDSSMIRLYQMWTKKFGKSA